MSIDTASITAAIQRYANLVLEQLGLVNQTLNTRAPLDSPPLTGSPTAPTPTLSDSSKRLANTEFVKAAVAQVAGGGALTWVATDTETYTAAPNSRYYLLHPVTVTLPDTTELAIGTAVTFTKRFGVTCTLRTYDLGSTIVFNGMQDSQVIFNQDGIITVFWSGTVWEMHFNSAVS